MQRIFCACAPGLEPLLAAELRALGLAAAETPGGAEAEGEDAAALACLGARLADAVKVRTARGSVDAAGEPLFRRGWRARVGAAPLRETLAAALLAAAGWRGETPLLDPMCGAGTIAIEAALVAARRPPGEGRSFAFERWPGHDPARTAALRARLSAGARTPPYPVHASDRNQGALRLARKNAEAAGVLPFLSLARADAALAPAPAGAGTLVVNPPYGERLGDAGAALEALARLLERLPGWSAAVLGPERGPGLPGREPAAALAVRNGGLRCRLLLYRP